MLIANPDEEQILYLMEQMLEDHDPRLRVIEMNIDFFVNLIDSYRELSREKIQ